MDQEEPKGEAGVEVSEVMNVDEAAGFLRVNPKTLREAVNRGQVPARRIGRVIRLERSVLLDWLRAEAR